MAPLLPGLSDHPSSLERVIVAAREAGACGIWANLLYLRPGTREHFLDCLAHDWPELLPEYERLYARSSYLPQAEARPAKEDVRRLAKLHGVRDRRTVKLHPPERDEQLSLLSA
jgi:DNA repair photolyase